MFGQFLVLIISTEYESHLTVITHDWLTVIEMVNLITRPWSIQGTTIVTRGYMAWLI